VTAAVLEYFSAGPAGAYGWQTPARTPRRHTAGRSLFERDSVANLEGRVLTPAQPGDRYFEYGVLDRA
jgi:hypothetical protein